jgi:hypothetical protein
VKFSLVNYTPWGVKESLVIDTDFLLLTFRLFASAASFPQGHRMLFDTRQNVSIFKKRMSDVRPCMNSFVLSPGDGDSPTQPVQRDGLSE